MIAARRSKKVTNITAAREQNMVKKIKISLVKSTIGSVQSQIASVRGLGLRKLNSHSILDETPEVLGMIKKVKHLITVEELKS